MPVTPVERRLWVAGALVLVGAQLTCTLLDQNVWPFCSYNMFNRRPGATTGAWRVRLHEEGGGVVEARPPSVVPLEFFRANAAFTDVYGGATDPGRRESLARAILVLLNEQPWPGFDETEAAAHPSPGQRFVGLEVWYLREPTLASTAVAVAPRRVFVYPPGFEAKGP